MDERESTTDGGVASQRPSSVTGPKTCANCGAVIDEYEWFPIRGREDADGEFQVYPFCGEGCVESWDGPAE